MKFLVDAQLPRRLVSRFRESGHDALHTLDLSNGNRTTDTEINDLSEREQRVVVTKDADFVNSFHLTGKPYKLLLISTGILAMPLWKPSSCPISLRLQPSLTHIVSSS